MAREIWNSEHGFIGTHADWLALMHCLSCAKRDGCQFVDTCGLESNWRHYAKDEESQYAKYVNEERVKA